MMQAHAGLRQTARHRNGGFTLFELAVVVAVTGILIIVLLSRVMFYRNEAERLAFQQTLTALRAETSLQAYARLIAGRPREIAALAGMNPVNWLAQPPPNYLGEFYSPDTKKLASGSWYFDRSDGILVYLLDKGNTFDVKGSELLKFKVSLPKGATTGGPTNMLELAPVQVRKQ